MLRGPTGLSIGPAMLALRRKSKQEMKKIALNWKQRLLKSYSSWSIIANILIALSVSGLSVLGVIASEVALPATLCFAIPLGILGLAGRILDQGLDDVRPDDARESEDAE